MGSKPSSTAAVHNNSIKRKRSNTQASHHNQFETKKSLQQQQQQILNNRRNSKPNSQQQQQQQQQVNNTMNTKSNKFDSQECERLFSRYADPDESSMITPDGTRQFFEDLGLSIEDVMIFAIAWKMHTSTMGNYYYYFVYACCT
ncbi:MAG: hypothetical protein EXX96DRAFT_217097 [Benjaminiella poitrasii]|nr:MAG: hypothetical protein EXX96DRAFT_217097 [Benjaminiella poitrasii]